MIAYDKRTGMIAPVPVWAGDEPVRCGRCGRTFRSADCSVPFETLGWAEVDCINPKAGKCPPSRVRRPA